MSWLVVTPARNEAARITALAESLRRQTRPDLIGLWVIVDDGSTDGTATVMDASAMPFPMVVVQREKAGTLIKGGAFAAWREGVEKGLVRVPTAERILKLDADIVLAPDYLELLSRHDDVALVGGVLDDGTRPQRHHVRGALKAYSSEAWEHVATLPTALGFDVMDEVLLRAKGLDVLCDTDAKAECLRATGSSEGAMHGRYRNGVNLRWTGYDVVYALLRLARFAAQRPYVVGSFAAAWGWLRGGAGPYPAELKRRHRQQQRRRLASFLRHPGRYRREEFL